MPGVIFSGGLQIGGQWSDRTAGIAADISGNFFVSGTTSDSGGGMGSWPSWYVPWLVKYAPTGEVLWWRNPESTGDTEASGVAADPNGNAIVTGGKWLRDSYGHLTREGAGWIVQYSEAGDLLWARPVFDHPQGVVTDSSGNILMRGQFFDADGDAGYAWVAKYSPDGKFLWKWRLRTRSQPGMSPSYAITDIAVGWGDIVLATGTVVDAHGRQSAWVAELRP